MRYHKYITTYKHELGNTLTERQHEIIWQKRGNTNLYAKKARRSASAHCDKKTSQLDNHASFQCYTSVQS